MFFFETRCIYGECEHEQHVRRTLTLTLTQTITAYSVSGNVVRVCILSCATRHKPCRKKEFTEDKQFANAFCSCDLDLDLRAWPLSSDYVLAYQMNFIGQGFHTLECYRRTWTYYYAAFTR